jgi:MerR family transcriptional regulator/heat shock protein HspR
MEATMQDNSKEQIRYTRTMAVRLADISLEFLERCEAERLIEVRTEKVDEPSFSTKDIRQLLLIRRLHDVLGIDIQDLEVVLHLRSQLLDLQNQMQEMERRWVAREEELLNEMLELRRRLAEDADWE